DLQRGFFDQRLAQQGAGGGGTGHDGRSGVPPAPGIPGVSAASPRMGAWFQSTVGAFWPRRAVLSVIGRTFGGGRSRLVSARPPFFGTYFSRSAMPSRSSSSSFRVKSM